MLENEVLYPFLTEARDFKTQRLFPSPVVSITLSWLSVYS